MSLDDLHLLVVCALLGAPSWYLYVVSAAVGATGWRLPTMSIDHFDTPLPSSLPSTPAPHHIYKNFAVIFGNLTPSRITPLHTAVLDTLSCLPSADRLSPPPQSKFTCSSKLRTLQICLLANSRQCLRGCTVLRVPDFNRVAANDG